MAASERRRQPAIMSALSGSHSAALEPLFEIVETLSGRVRLTVLSIRDDALDVVESKGADPLPIGTTLEPLVMGAFRERLLDDGSFVIDIADEGLPEDTRQALERFGFERAFVASLHSFDSVTECVVVDEPGSRMTFDGPRLKLLVAAVSQARVALENADLRIQAAKREITMETIVRLGIAFGSVLELELTAAQVVDYAAMLLDLPAFVLLFRGEGAPDFEVLAAEGLPPGASHLKVTPIEVAGLEAHQAGDLALGGLPASAPGSLFEALELAGLTHTLVAPMIVGDGRLRGVLLGLDRRRFEPSSEERDAFHLLSMQAANAIWSAELFEAAREAQRRAGLELAKNMRLLETQRESARLSEALNNVNRAVHSTLEIDEVMQHALDAGVEALSCDSGVIEICEGGEWVVRYQTGLSPQDVGMRLSREAPVATRAEREPAPFQIEILTGDEHTNVGLVKEYGLKSVLAVPLFARDEVTGRALFYTSKDVRRFTDSEIDFGRKLGSVVSLGLVNARLYSLERNTAETLQRALLTLPESLRGIEFATSYRSATESTLVGGDFYDTFELDADRIGITIGDISGKGLDAAVLTSLVKHTIRAHAEEPTKAPAQVLSLTNDLVYRSTPTEAFATVFFAILDRHNGRLSFANAGHTTGAIMKSGGLAAKLPVTDPILGAFDSIEFCESEVQLKLGEILFLYTDGLTEARGDGEFYGEERLFELLASSRRTFATDVVADVMDDVMSFASGHFRDDLAILAVRRLSSGSTEF